MRMKVTPEAWVVTATTSLALSLVGYVVGQNSMRKKLDEMHRTQVKILTRLVAVETKLDGK